MPYRRELNIARREALVLAARAGMVPASDDIEDELNARTARIARAVRVYARLTGGRDDLAITDLLKDLRHYCDNRAFEFDELDKATREHYVEETNEGWGTRSLRRTE